MTSQSGSRSMVRKAVNRPDDPRPAVSCTASGRVRADRPGLARSRISVVSSPPSRTRGATEIRRNVEAPIARRTEGIRIRPIADICGPALDGESIDFRKESLIAA
jgi:hypothetical protein